MNWKQEAKDDLISYNRKKGAINNLEQQIKQLEVSCNSIRSAATDGTPVSGGGNCREDFLLNNIVKREKLEANLDATRQWCKTVEAALNALSAEDRLILDRMYVNRRRGHVERLEEELKLTKTAVYKRVDAAMLRFVQAYYGCAIF